MTNQLHYRGDVTGIDPTSFIGADRFGAFYRPVTATFDASTDRTTIDFLPIPPADMPRFADDKVRQMEDRMRIAQLFGGRW